LIPTWEGKTLDIHALLEQLGSGKDLPRWKRTKPLESNRIPGKATKSLNKRRGSVVCPTKHYRDDTHASAGNTAVLSPALTPPEAEDTTPFLVMSLKVKLVTLAAKSRRGSGSAACSAEENATHRRIAAAEVVFIENDIFSVH
jgi:hypothetical protein